MSFGSAEEIINLSGMTWDRFLSELKEGKIYEIVAPVPKENLAECRSSSTVDENVLETGKTKRLGAQILDALKSSPFYKVLRSRRGVFPTEVPNHLPGQWVPGTRITWNLAPRIE